MDPFPTLKTYLIPGCLRGKKYFFSFSGVQVEKKNIVRALLRILSIYLSLFKDKDVFPFNIKTEGVDCSL